MRQRVHLITLGVEDPAAAASFYDALGWTRADTTDAMVVYDLYGASLALYSRAHLARDIGIDLPNGSGAVTLACNVRRREEVADVIAAARAAGAPILREPADVFWGGHIAYFADPDGHLWEVAHNPLFWIGPPDGDR